MNNVKIVKELDRIAAQNGGVLLPEKVVEAAKPKNSILHSRFEWNDSLAAHQYRLYQARHLINVTVRLVETPGFKKMVSAWVSFRPERAAGGGYHAMATVLSDAQMREQLLADALADLNTFQLKYATLKELAGVFAAINKARSRRAA
jgi:hypothetical protein